MCCYTQHAAQEQNVKLLFAEPIEDFWEEATHDESYILSYKGGRLHFSVRFEVVVLTPQPWAGYVWVILVGWEGWLYINPGLNPKP